MGYSCRKENVLFVFVGLEVVFFRYNVGIEVGKVF